MHTTATANRGRSHVVRDGNDCTCTGLTYGVSQGSTAVPIIFSLFYT